MKMLILEDDANVKTLVIEFIKESLMKSDLEIHWATSIRKAFELLEKNHYDCQIVDIKVEDGFSWDYIEKTKNQIRTLATSAHIRESEKKGVRFLSKPYSLIEFMKELSFLLGEKSDFPEYESMLSDSAKRQ